MKNRIYIQILTVVAGLFLSVAMANAQATRTWVSGVGDDVNPCSRTAPCKTFAGAISKTAEGGEIDALDPGGFGTVTITKAMTIEGTHGAGFGSILNAGTNGININITAGTHINDAVVILRSLYIQGTSQGLSPSINAINYTRCHRVFVNDCHFENQGNSGINASLATAGSLFVRDCDFTNTNAAIRATTTVNPLFVEATNISVFGNNDGVLFTNNASGSVNNSFFTRIVAGSAISASSNCFVNVTHCHLASNNIALNALAGCFMRVNENELFDNSTGFAGVASAIQSGGNNKLANSPGITPTGTPLTTQ